MQYKCDTLVCVWVSSCKSVCSVFVCVFALTFIAKSVCIQICHTMQPYVCLCVCVCVYTWWACGTCWRKMERNRTMCHNYVQGVTLKIALKPDELVFTNINIQIEHHTGVSDPLLSHNSLFPSLVAMLFPLSCHFLCVFMGVCQYGKCMQFLSHLFPLFEIWEGERRGTNDKKSCDRSRSWKIHIKESAT